LHTETSGCSAGSWAAAHFTDTDYQHTSLLLLLLLLLFLLLLLSQHADQHRVWS
jgi:hypothetical protein